MLHIYGLSEISCLESPIRSADSKCARNDPFDSYISPDNWPALIFLLAQGDDVTKTRGRSRSRSESAPKASKAHSVCILELYELSLVTAFAKSIFSLTVKIHFFFLTFFVIFPQFRFSI